MSEELMVKVEDVYKRYRLGTIGGGTLTGDLQSWWAKVRGKEDPNSKIGAKVYGKNEVFYALNGISFEVKKGEALGIIGGNGAGKSTTLKLLSQVTAPTAGKIYLNGRITSMLEVGTGFHPELTGRENIYMNGAILGMTKAEIDKKIEDIIEFSECRQFIDTPVKRYSSGMYVKLAFSVAAHLDSEIMIMDEVLAVGDMAFQKKCIDKMKHISNDEDRTILYVSHNMNTIRQLCDRCIVLDKGKVIFEGGVEDAISVYLEQKSQDLNTKFDYSNIQRVNPIHAKRCKINFLEFVDKKKAIFSCKETMNIIMRWESFEDVDRIKVLIAVSNAYNDRIGLSETLGFLNKTQKGEHSLEMGLNLSALAGGKYTLFFSLSYIDEFNNANELDETYAIPIEVIDDENTTVNWQKHWWGDIRLNKIEVKEN